jgi:hypothetical protein
VEAAKFQVSQVALVSNRMNTVETLVGVESKMNHRPGPDVWVLLVVDYHEVTQLKTQGCDHLNMAVEQACFDVVPSQTSCSGEAVVPFEGVSA